jgi:hypothetical protein
MKVKWVVLAVLAVFFASPAISGFAAIDTRAIEAVRNKGVLQSSDLFTIDNFLAEAIQELIKTKDFSTIAKIRTLILSVRGPQPQYAEQFSESALKYITAALEKAAQLPPDRRIKVIANLLILIDSLEDLKLSDLALARIKDKNAIIRYWAVHCITNDAIIKQLSAGGTANIKISRLFIDRLKDKEIVETSTPETLALIAKFAGDINIPQAEEMLIALADLRIRKYAAWTVEYELLDTTILNALAGKLGANPAGSPKPAVGVRFGQLYSFAIQRYAKGKDILTETRRQQLASVLVEVEDKCIVKLLGRPQTTIKRAIERDDYAALLEENNRLLGDATKAGELPTKLNYDYGTASDGRKRTGPLPLPEPLKKPKPSGPPR